MRFLKFYSMKLLLVGMVDSVVDGASLHIYLIKWEIIFEMVVNQTGSTLQHLMGFKFAFLLISIYRIRSLHHFVENCFSGQWKENCSLKKLLTLWIFDCALAGRPDWENNFDSFSYVKKQTLKLSSDWCSVKLILKNPGYADNTTQTWFYTNIRKRKATRLLFVCLYAWCLFPNAKC